MAKAKPRKARGPEVPFPLTTKVKLLSGKQLSRYPGRGQYRAGQIGDLVTVDAMGMAPNFNTEVILLQLPIMIFPPQFGLFFIDGPITLPATKPFHVTATFYSAQDLKTVTVWDADGRHDVRVQQF